MSDKKYTVKLTAGERACFEETVRGGKAAAWKVQRAQAALKFDQGESGPGWTDKRIAEAFGVTTRSLEHWRKQAVLQGPSSLLERKPRETPPTEAKFDGEKEARLTAIACSKAPEGYARWSLRLLADRVVTLEIVDSVSHETIRQVLKKTS